MSGPPAVAPVTRRLDQHRVDAYAEAARDRNPLHVDREFALRSGFGGAVAHGMLVLALVSEVMSAAFGRRWAERGALKVRWRQPALCPVTVTARAVLRAERDGVATYDVTCVDEQGVELLTGIASAPYE